MALSSPTTDQRILAVQGLSKYFPITSGLMRRVTGHVRAVDDVNIYVNAGETLSIVGESGSGKTTLGRMIVRAIEPTRSEIMLKTDKSTWVDLAKLEGNQLRAVRRHFHMIFQDPSASLNPRMRVRDIVMEPLLYNNIAKEDAALEMVRNTLKLVGLQEQHMNRYPHAIFYRPQRAAVGDVIPFYANGEFKLFYIHLWRDPGTPVGELDWHLVGTRDFIHYQEYGSCDIPGGTGAVSEVNGMYHLFYCLFQDGGLRQIVCHAPVAT